MSRSQNKEVVEGGGGGEKAVGMCLFPLLKAKGDAMIKNTGTVKMNVLVVKGDSSVHTVNNLKKIGKVFNEQFEVAASFPIWPGPALYFPPPPPPPPLPPSSSLNIKP